MTGYIDSKERNKQRRAGQEQSKANCTNVITSCSMHGNLVVTVKEACTGQCLKGIQVRITGPEKQTGTTDTEGKAFFYHIMNGGYLMTVDGSNLHDDEESLVAVVNINETKRVELTLKREGALIIYGRGGELGDFSVFAHWLRKDLVKNENYGIAKGTYDEDHIAKPIHIENKQDFFAYLEEPHLCFKIKELHIFSHSVGAGLFIGYHSHEVGRSREEAQNRAENRHITYEEVRDAEIGGILTDDLITPEKVSKQATIKSHFAKNAFIKLWGCNAGVAEWRYGGDAPGTYYWQALNEKNTPKPSISQTFADYFGVNVYGATSGAHIEVKSEGRWITTSEYQKKYRRSASTNLPHRLHPDRGDYILHTPSP